MDLSNLKPAERSKFSKKRVGRGQGSGNGVQAGRGHKGAKSRSGFKFKRGFEGGQMPLHRRIPKRGFHNPFRVEYAVVNLDTLAERFDEGTVVTPELLRERRLIHGARQPIKVLARGDIAKKLTVQAHKFSGKAAEKIRRGRRRDGSAGSRVGRHETNRGDADAELMNVPRLSASAVRETMDNALKNLFAVTDLRNRVLFTLAMLGVYRVGSHIPTPGINQEALDIMAQQAAGTMFGLYNMFSGGNLANMTIFALGVMPYISASIILQLLTVVWPYLERISKEGELGRRKITQYTRYLTLVLAVVQAFGIAIWLERSTDVAGGLPLVYDTRLGLPADDRADADDRHDVHHVAGRADHRARHRQRHVADHLRRHRRQPAERDPADVRPDVDRADRSDPRAVPAGDGDRGGRRRSCSSSGRTGASPCSTPSASSAGGSTAAPARTSR